MRFYFSVVILLVVLTGCATNLGPIEARLGAIEKALRPDPILWVRTTNNEEKGVVMEVQLDVGQAVQNLSINVEGFVRKEGQKKLEDFSFPVVVFGWFTEKRGRQVFDITAKLYRYLPEGFTLKGDKAVEAHIGVDVFYRTLRTGEKVKKTYHQGAMVYYD